MEDPNSDISRTNSSDMSPKIPRTTPIHIGQLEGQQIARIPSTSSPRDDLKYKIKLRIPHSETREFSPMHQALYSLSFIEAGIKNINFLYLYDNYFHFYFRVIELRKLIRSGREMEEKHLFREPLTEIQIQTLLRRLYEIYKNIGIVTLEIPNKSCCLRIGISTPDNYIAKEKEKKLDEIEKLLPKVVSYFDGIIFRNMYLSRVTSSIANLNK